MRIVLHAAALDGQDELLALIDRLVDRIADEVHRVEVPEADRLRSSRWYRSARQTRRRILLSAVARPPRATPHAPHRQRIDVCDTAGAQLAVKRVHTPLTILVEDRESDGVFLDLLIEELGIGELGRLWARGKTATPPAVEVGTAGGVGAMPARIRRAAEDAAEKERPIRLFVLCDGDARWPNDTRNDDADRVRKACQCAGLNFHILRKRTIENYIPDRVFEAIRGDPQDAARVARIDALLRRTPAQRDHFPIKDGLSPKERKDATDAGLYSSEDDGDDLDLLEGERLFTKATTPATATA